LSILSIFKNNLKDSLEVKISLSSSSGITPNRKSPPLGRK
jgi:hypothetical protein